MEHPPGSHLVVTQGRFNFECPVSDEQLVTFGLYPFAKLCDTAVEDKLGYLDPDRTWHWVDRHWFRA